MRSNRQILRHFLRSKNGFEKFLRLQNHFSNELYPFLLFSNPRKTCRFVLSSSTRVERPPTLPILDSFWLCSDMFCIVVNITVWTPTPIPQLGTFPSPGSRHMSSIHIQKGQFDGVMLEELRWKEIYSGGQ